MALTDRKDPYLGLHFFVEIDGIDHSGFAECSGLEAKTDVFEYEEGGLNDYKHKLPGRTSFTNVTLKRGMTDSDELWNWYAKVIQGTIERKEISIVQYNSQQKEVRRWDLSCAYPVKWSGPAFNAGSNAVSIETLEIAYHGFKK
jgi:phage tail-like protein